MVNRRILFLILFLLSINSFSQEGVATAPVTAANEPSMVALAEQIGSETKGFHAQYVALQPVVAKLTSSVPMCEKGKVVADTMCLESLNPSIAKYAGEYGNVAQMVLAAGSSITEQCSGISKALDAAGTALGSYQVACKAAHEGCQYTCKGTVAAVTELRAAMGRAIAAMRFGIDDGGVSQQQLKDALQAKASIEANLVKIAGGTESRTRVCAGYQVSIASAGLGIANAAKGLLKSKKCEEQTSNQQAGVGSGDCKNPSYPGYSTPSCQCARGERSAAECQNINVSGANLKAGTISIPKPAGISTGSGSGGSLDIGGEEQASVGNVGGSPSGAGAPGGGGGGVGGGASGNGTIDGAANSAAKRLNTNILGGGFGGGGSGGGNGAGPGYGMDAKLKDYMPGGKNDPSRSVASQLAKEVTPQAGRTNWEKVKLRYRDNTGSLLNK